MSSSEETIRSFVEVTGGTEAHAKFFLELSAGNVEDAINAYLESGGDMAELPQQQPQEQQKRQPAFGAAHNHDDDDDDDDHGYPRTVTPPSAYHFENSDLPSGERHRTSGGMQVHALSALVGTGNAKPTPPADRVADIFEKAKELGAMSAEEASATRPKNFVGMGQSLGSTNASTPSKPIMGETAPIVRTLTFWSDGFSVDDGPLREYTDPANTSLLKQIQSGVAPRELMDPTQPWREVEINLVDKKGDKYVAPKKKFQAFVGGGHSLAEPSSSSSVAPSETVSNRGLSVNENEPITSISVRLANGTRLVAKFNHTHTVEDLYSFIRSSQATRQPFELMTTFPHNVLTNMKLSLQDANLLNASVVQKML